MEANCQIYDSHSSTRKSFPASTVYWEGSNIFDSSLSSITVDFQLFALYVPDFWCYAPRPRLPMTAQCSYRIHKLNGI